MSIEAILARAFQLLLALTGAYTLTLWFALIVWTFRDIESRSRSVIAQIFSTLIVVLFFLPGVLIYLILRPKETLDEAFGRSLEEEYLLQDLEDLSLCTTCHHPVRDEYVVCPNCYTELRRHCSSCSRLVDMTWAICPYCTADLAQDRDETGTPWREERPALAPAALRMLHERTEVHLERTLGAAKAEETGKLGEGAAPTPLLAQRMEETGSWTDENDKRSWILTRAREVFRPLMPSESSPYVNGNGHRHDEEPEQRPEHAAGLNGHAANGQGAETGEREYATVVAHEQGGALNGLHHAAGEPNADPARPEREKGEAAEPERTESLVHATATRERVESDRD